MTTFAEVGIVGGGPAGARVAELLARRGTDVVVWDPKAPWEKPCGGGLTHGLLAAVPEVREVIARARVIERVMLAAGNVLVPVRLDRAMYIIARRELGEWQLGRARAAGARIDAVGVRGIARAAGGWAVTLRDGIVRVVRHLVGADGAASLVRAAVAPAVRVGLEPTRVTYPEASADTDSVITLKFSSGLQGYAWDFPRPGHHSIGAVMGPGAGGRERLDAEVHSLLGGARSPTSVNRSTSANRGAVIGSALYPIRRGIGGDDFALVGDAAGLADPATGEGITNAFRSGALAAEVFATDRSFRRYARAAAATFEPEFRAARWLRRLMYDRGWAVALIEAASRRAQMAAVAERMMNDTNEHRSRAAMIARLALAVLRRPRLGRDFLASGLVEQPE